MPKKIAIIGAGPTGLGAAWYLHHAGYKNYTVYERNDHPGGLASSVVDEKGFTWDLGGHVIFSHYKETDHFFSEMMGDGYLEHMRESWVRILGRWVPYPFQNNIRYLPKEALWDCVQGLLRLDRTQPAEHFGSWIDQVFGEGIAKYFMRPYNWKVWATPLHEMSKEWIAERVSVIDLERVLRNIVLELDDVAWGPNNRFKFQLNGGTGQIFKNVQPILGDHLQLNRNVVSVDADQKRLSFADGSTDSYDVLISTMPIDLLVRMTRGLEPLIPKTKDLVHNNVAVVGIGVEGQREDNRSWMYFPEKDCPFYRITNFFNYSYNNVPDPKRFFSLMAEISWSAYKKEDLSRVVDQTVEGLVNTGLLRKEEIERIVSRTMINIEYAYPIPTLRRNDALVAIHPELEYRDIYSRGRFGAWRYEVGNMDHSLMQGMEIAGRIIEGKKETVFTS